MSETDLFNEKPLSNWADTADEPLRKRRRSRKRSVSIDEVGNIHRFIAQIPIPIKQENDKPLLNPWKKPIQLFEDEINEEKPKTFIRYKDRPIIGKPRSPPRTPPPERENEWRLIHSQKRKDSFRNQILQHLSLKELVDKDINTDFIPDDYLWVETVPTSNNNKYQTVLIAIACSLSFFCGLILRNNI